MKAGNMDIKYWAKEKKIIVICVVIACILLAALYLIPVRYIFPSMDDYQYANEISDRTESSADIFRACVDQTAVRYMNWEGRYFNVFILYMVIAFTHMNTNAVRISVLFIIVLFFISILFLLKEVFIDINRENKVLVIFSAFFTIVFSGFSKGSPSEALYWLSGVYGYILPFSCAMLSLALYLCYFNTSKMRYLWISALLAIMTSGGVLMCAAFICCETLFIWFMRSWNKCENNKKYSFDLVPFYFALSGAVINVAAPGNYIRSNGIKESANIPVLIEGTIKSSVFTVGYLSVRQFLLAGGLIMFIMILCTSGSTKTFQKEPDGKNRLSPIAVWIYQMFVVVVSLMPVVLGYKAVIIPWRVRVMLDFISALNVLYCFVYTGRYVYSKYNGNIMIHRKKATRKTFGIVVIMLILFSFSAADYSENSEKIILYELKNGILERFGQQEQATLNCIMNSPNKDVLISEEQVKCYTLKDMNLKDDPSYWVNKQMAEFYGKDSIALNK
jgi:hypothetical protein